MDPLRFRADLSFAAVGFFAWRSFALSEGLPNMG